jgi:hypothetical protein
MRTRLFLIILLLFLPPAFAETSRYQAVVIPEAGRTGQSANLSSRVFILDTVEGHLWTWGENEAIYNDIGGKPRFGTALIYQGRVKPGTKMGEVIEMNVQK